jgi:hypothetical protein
MLANTGSEMGGYDSCATHVLSKILYSVLLLVGLFPDTPVCTFAIPSLQACKIEHDFIAARNTTAAGVKVSYLIWFSMPIPQILQRMVNRHHRIAFSLY